MNKIYLIIGLILCQQLVSAQGNLAVNVYAPQTYELQNKRSQSGLKSVLNKMEKKFHIFFNYDPDILRDKSIPSNFKPSDNLDETLDGLLKPLKLRYKDLGNNYYAIIRVNEEPTERKTRKSGLSVPESSVNPERRTNSNNGVISPLIPDQSNLSKWMEKTVRSISGQVVDQDGEPLIGVNIQVKGTNKGAVTDFEGNFILEDIDENAVLVVSYVGYQTQEVLVAGKSNLNIILVSDSQLLDEVVVVGYGTQKKVNLTGAVDVVNGQKLQNRASPTVSQLLQGVSPGINLNISNNEGFQPGAEMDISIRGIGSLSGGSPYVLIDGFEGNLNNINPEDIESISILKDAAASAIYGAKAPYGVILITTKSGERNKDLSVNYSSNIMLNTPQPLPESLNSYTYARVINEAGFNRGGEVYSHETIDRMIAYQNKDWEYIKNSIPQWPEGATNFGAYPLLNNQWDDGILAYGNTDGWDVHFGHSINHSHNLSMNGGSDNFSYYFSAGYINQSGVLTYPTDKFSRINLSGKFEFDIAKWWKFKYETSLARKNREKSNYYNYGDYDLMFFNIASFSAGFPNLPLKDGWGNYTGNSSIPAMRGTDKTKLLDYWNKFKMEFQPLNNWRIYTDFGYNTQPLTGFDVSKYSLLGNVKDGSLTVIDGRSVPNYVRETNQDYRYWTTNIYTTYGLNINDTHNFNFSLGGQLEKGQINYLQVRKDNLINEDIPSLQTASGSATIDEDLSHNATQGYFSRLEYNYKEKYLLETNYRYDGSYVFKHGKRWGGFPSFALGWNIHKENFWINIQNNFISSLKIRGSWGQLGNQQILPYTDLNLVNYSSNKLNWIFDYGSLRKTGYVTPFPLVNPNLTWETATTKNLGIDLSILNNRLEISLDVFDRATTDMIGPSEPKPGVIGADVPQANNASLRTKGWELSLNYRNDLNDKLSFYINANLSDYTSVVTKYYNPSKLLSAWWEGSEIGVIYGYTVNDLIRTDNELDDYIGNYDLSFISTEWHTGDLRYEDINNDGKINNGENTVDNMGDLSIIGNSEPHYNFGVNLGLTYKNFNLSMLWSGVAKKDIYFGSSANIFWGFMGYWWDSSIQPRNLDYYRDEPGTKYRGLYMGEENINRDAYWPRPYANYEQNNKSRANPNTRYLQAGSYIRLHNIRIAYSLPDRFINSVFINKLNIYLSGENLLTFTKLPNGIDPIALKSNTQSGTRFGQSQGGLTYGADRIFALGISLIL